MLDPDSLALGAHALISDTATAAVVGADGTISWWCPGRFDRDAAFYRLIDPQAGGALGVAPAPPAGGGRARTAPGRQAYDPRTNVVRTNLARPDGEIEVADFMPWAGGGERPQGRIVRLVTARRGPVAVSVEVAPGRGFAPARRVSPWSAGVAFDGLAVRCDAEPRPVPTGRDTAVWVATRVLEAGERMVVTVDDLSDDHHRPLSPDAAAALLDATATAWRRHVDRIEYGGPYRAAVERSLLVVKALTHYASGAAVDAATASLPEVPGGERNFDRRCASIATVALAAEVWRRTGLADESDAAARWLRTVVEAAELPLDPAYDLEGGPAPPEEELALPGRRHSQPVRVGVLGRQQDAGLQLDLYGDLVAVVVEAAPGGPLDGARPALHRMADWLADHWDQPDRGVWEVRSRPRPLVSSRVQGWWALDRMARWARAHNPLDLDAVGWQMAAAAILKMLETDALTGGAPAGEGGQYGERPGMGGLRRELTGPELPDAALLRVAWRGPWPADHPVVTRTVERVVRQLSDGPYLRRYPPEMDDGLAGAPGADLLASLWAVRALAATGRWEEAHHRMEALCATGPLGLLAAGVDPLSGALTGNLPSTPAHLTLVETALALAGGPR